MPIRILEKDPVKMRDKSSKAKWITKKPKSWITKKPKKMEDKETTSKWITKKSEPKWITKKGHKPEMDLGGTGKKNWITKKKPVQSRSRHQSVAEDKRLSPTDKYERDVLGKDMSDKYKEKKATGGRAGKQSGGRTNLLEELGRVEGESSNRNRRAEISRVHGELNKGYKSGGAVLKGKKVGIQIK